MAFWKSILPQLFPFESEEPESCTQPNVPEKTELLGPPKTMSTIDSDRRLFQAHPQKNDPERLFFNQTSQLTSHGSVGHPAVLETLLRERSCKTGEEASLYHHVVEEVFRREIMIALERIEQRRNLRNDDDVKLIDKQEKTIDSLRHQLRELSDGANDTRESARLLVKEKHELICACREYREQNSKLNNQLDELNAEHEILGDRVIGWTKLSEQWEARALELQEAKVIAQARVLRAEQKAELAELRAEHAKSQSRIMDKRLKEAKSSSNVVCQRVEELRKLHAGILRNLANQSPRSGRHMSESPTRFIGKGYKAIRRLWVSIPLPKNRDPVPAETMQRMEDGDETTNVGSVEDKDSTGVKTQTGPMPKHLGFGHVFSMNIPTEQNNQLDACGNPPLDPVAQTLRALEANLIYLREVVQSKQHEVDRLHGELQAVASQSNTFERRLSEERHKVQVMERNRGFLDSKSCVLATYLDSNDICAACVNGILLKRRSRQDASLREDRPCRETSVGFSGERAVL